MPGPSGRLGDTVGDGQIGGRALIRETPRSLRGACQPVGQAVSAARDAMRSARAPGTGPPARADVTLSSRHAEPHVPVAFADFDLSETAGPEPDHEGRQELFGKAVDGGMIGQAGGRIALVGHGSAHSLFWWPRSEPGRRRSAPGRRPRSRSVRPWRSGWATAVTATSRKEPRLR